MKNIKLLFLFTVFLLSCQANAENIKSHLSENIVKTSNTEPKIIPTPSPKLNTQVINQKVGIVDVSKENIVCLRTKNADLAENTPIAIVDSLFNPPQKVISTSVKKKLEKSCARGDSEAGEDFEKNSYYSLNLSADEVDEIGIGIAVINPSKSIETHKDLVSIDINNDGKAEYFRHCASYEGTHLTIWTGKPLKGKRIWHSYYYLGYDTEGDCTEKEASDMENEKDF